MIARARRFLDALRARLRAFEDRHPSLYFVAFVVAVDGVVYVALRIGGQA